MDKSPLSLLLSKLSGPSPLSPSSHKECSSPLIIFMFPSWTHSRMSCLSCPGEPSTSPTGQSTSDAKEGGGRTTYFNLPNASQEAVGILCCQNTLLAPGPLVHQNLHFSIDTLSSQLLPAWTGATRCRTLHFPSLEFNEIPVGSFVHWRLRDMRESEYR